MSNVTAEEKLARIKGACLGLHTPTKDEAAAFLSTHILQTAVTAEAAFHIAERAETNLVVISKNQIDYKKEYDEFNAKQKEKNSSLDKRITDETLPGKIALGVQVLQLVLAVGAAMAVGPAGAATVLAAKPL